MSILRVSEVFTPTSPAKYSFIERESKVNDLLVDALNTCGKQIILYGHTGCGKTTLLLNKLNQMYEGFVITRCMKSTTFENILLDGFDQLSPFYVDEVESEKTADKSREIGLEYNQLKAKLSNSNSSRIQSRTKRSIVPQLTAQRLAKFFGETKSCWVLEDFHKVIPEEKIKASQMMKIFMDSSYDFPDLKIIALGAVGTGREVVEYDIEMNDRITEIFVPLMKEIEIISIIKKGEKLLNLRLDVQLQQKIAKFSLGLASVCHQLCLNMCQEKNILFAQENTVSFSISDLDKAIQKYLVQKADSFKAQYDKAIKVDHKSAVNLPKEILKTAIEINKEEFTLNEIYSSLKRIFKSIPLSIIKKIMDEFQTTKRSEILFFDANSNNYFFSSQFSKAYMGLRFEEEKSNYLKKQTLKELEKSRFDRLLEIIEKSLNDYE